MNEIKCTIYTSKLSQSKRKKLSDTILSKNDDELNITFCESDTFDTFEKDLNDLRKSSFFYRFKKRFSSLFLSIISVAVILFDVISIIRRREK